MKSVWVEAINSGASGRPGSGVLSERSLFLELQRLPGRFESSEAIELVSPLPPLYLEPGTLEELGVDLALGLFEELQEQGVGREREEGKGPRGGRLRRDYRQSNDLGRSEITMERS